MPPKSSEVPNCEIAALRPGLDDPAWVQNHLKDNLFWNSFQRSLSFRKSTSFMFAEAAVWTVMTRPPGSIKMVSQAFLWIIVHFTKTTKREYRTGRRQPTGSGSDITWLSLEVASRKVVAKTVHLPTEIPERPISGSECRNNLLLGHPQCRKCCCTGPTVMIRSFFPFDID